MPDAPRLRFVVFDLDGTLVDSRPGIEWAAARAVADVWPGRRPVSLASLIGPPIRAMLAEAYPDASAASLEALVRAFRSSYDGEGWRRTQPFAGVPEVLATLLAEGLRLHVVTNKPATPTRLILDHLSLTGAFEAVLSPDSRSGPFASKAEGLTYVCRRYHGGPRSGAYVGDAHEDRVAAKLAGLPFVAVNYGYGAIARQPSDADLAVIERPSQLSRLATLSEQP